MLRELASEKPPVIVDVPASIRGRSMRHYPEMLSFLHQHYCFHETMIGRNERVADIYHLRAKGEQCDRLPPPLFHLK